MSPVLYRGTMRNALLCLTVLIALATFVSAQGVSCSGVGPIAGANWSAGCVASGGNQLMQSMPPGLSDVSIVAVYDKPVQLRVSQNSVAVRSCYSTNCTIHASLNPLIKSEVYVVGPVGSNAWPCAELIVDYTAQGAMAPPVLNLLAGQPNGLFFAQRSPYLYSMTAVAGLVLWADLGANLTLYVVQNGRVFYSRTSITHFVVANSTGIVPVDIMVVVPAGLCQAGCPPAQFFAAPLPLPGDWPQQGTAAACAPAAPINPSSSAGARTSVGNLVMAFVVAVFC